MRITQSLLSLLLLAALVQSCVPARKYEEMESKYKSCDGDLTACKTNAENLEKKNKDLESELSELKKSAAALKSDTTIMGTSLRTLRFQYDKINDLNREIQRQLDFLRKGAEDDSKKLTAQLEATRLELLRKEEDLNKRTKELEDKEKRIEELESLLAKKDAAVKQLKDKVADALLGFKDKGLTVEQKNGKVYVSMDAKLLFASLSYNVDKEGKDALLKLAKVLETQSDLEVLVEGHTDNDKIHRKETPVDNWELSVLRATSVVKIMLENSKMDPKRVTAAGRSEFVPVDVNDKAKNRRIEIILIPNLDELYRLLEK